MNIGPAEIALPIVLLTMAGMLTYGGVCIFKKDKDKTPTQAPSLTTSQTKEAVEKEKVDKEDIYELPNNPKIKAKNPIKTQNNQTFNHYDTWNSEEINSKSIDFNPDNNKSIASQNSIDDISNLINIEVQSEEGDTHSVHSENQIEEEETPDGSSNDIQQIQIYYTLRSSSAGSFNGDTNSNTMVDSEDGHDPFMASVNKYAAYDGQNGHISSTKTISKSKQKRLNAKNKGQKFKKGKPVK